MQFKNALLILSCFVVSCSTKNKSRQNSPEKPEQQDIPIMESDGDNTPTSGQPKLNDSSPINSSENSVVDHGFEDLIEHRKMPNSAIEPVCIIPGDDGDCLAYRLVKAYFFNESDRASTGVGTIKRICEQPEGAADQDCQYFRLERIAQ